MRSLLLPRILILVFLTSSSQAADPLTSLKEFVGSEACSTSGCHGGADPKRFQYQYWRHADPHSKSYSTLTSALSARMAETLRIPSALSSARCTACHAPMQGVSGSKTESVVPVVEGVSCENCHGAGQSWLRSHTRPDYAHVDRVAAGMRDLRHLYVRANSCVACHQHVDADLLQAGHPELIFELDGQTRAQPRHWQEFPGYDPAQAWLVGQAVALREMSWHLATTPSPMASEVQRWEALRWILSRVHLVKSELPDLGREPIKDGRDYLRIQKLADQWAREVAAQDWDPSQGLILLKQLAASAPEFLSRPDAALAGRRAERLVLGLDRLLASLPEEQAMAVDPVLKDLFAAAQVLQDFAPSQFGQHLEALSLRF